MITAPTFTARIDSALALDSLGTQSVNMSLYRSVFPGINNTAQYIRVYSALCWMVWRIDRTAEARGANTTEALEISARGMEKIELLLSWGNMLNDVRGMPGKLRNWSQDEAAEVDLRFDSVVGSEQMKLVGQPGVVIDPGPHFLTAPEYRPSIVNGLCFLAPHRGVPRMWELTPAGEKLADAFESMLAATGHPLAEWLANPTDVRITLAQVRTLWDPILNVRETTAGEREAFLANYFPAVDSPAPAAPNWKHRHAGLTLALRAIQTAEKHFSGNDRFVSVDDIRHTIGSRRAPGGAKLEVEGDERLLASAGYWTSLQYRQYTKLALETLLRMTEFEIHDAIFTDHARDIGAIAAAVSDRAQKGLPVGEDCVAQTIERLLGARLPQEPLLYRSGMQRPALGMGERIAQLSKAALAVRVTPGVQAVGARTPAQTASALAYEGLVYSALDAARWETDTGFKMSLEGDRLSLGELVRLVDEYRDAPPAEFLAHIVKEYVINLHFRVVRERSEWERNARDRYRIIMGDEGLERDLHHERDLASIDILADRLQRALNLLARAGILEQRGTVPGEENQFRLTEEGVRRASHVLEETALA